MDARACAQTGHAWGCGMCQRQPRARRHPTIAVTLLAAAFLVILLS